MKKLIQLLILCMLFMVNMSVVEAKGGSTTDGNFVFEYEVKKEGTWITRITPVSDAGIKVLSIPSRLGGKDVVRLGDKLEENETTNIFGVEYIDEDDIGMYPAEIYERMNRIKHIRIPDTVKVISIDCFCYVQEGKTINIPKGVTKNVEDLLLLTNWQKIIISQKNNKYKVVHGCLLSKNGKSLYGFAEKRKKFSVPETVKTIVALPRIYEGNFKIIIPKSVKKIETAGCHMGTGMTIKVAKENKKFAVKNGCLYNKKTGHLLTAYVSKKGVLCIPQGVTEVPNFLTYEAKKIILPASVKKVKSMVDYVEPGNLTCVAKGKKPFKFSCYDFSSSKKLTLYVPKGCKEVYEKAFKEVISEYPDQITIIEQD